MYENQFIYNERKQFFMAKENYRIPASLDMSYLDTEIALTNKAGAGFRPVPLKVIGIWSISIIVLMFLVTKSFLSIAGVSWCVFYGIWHLIFTWVYGNTDKSKRFGFSLIKPCIDYFSKAGRKLMTRSSDNAYPFLAMCNIKVIRKDGTIEYMDGTYGFGFRVVGSASYLLFEQDKINILNRVATFYNKIDTDVELIFDTTKESQKVDKPLSHTEELFSDCNNIACEGLTSLFVERHKVLRDYVGERFQSIHQYMFFKTPNLESLERFMAVFYDEVSTSSAMFKKVELMKSESVYEYFRTIYGKDK